MFVRSAELGFQWTNGKLLHKEKDLLLLEDKIHYMRPWELNSHTRVTHDVEYPAGWDSMQATGGVSFIHTASVPFGRSWEYLTSESTLTGISEKQIVPWETSCQSRVYWSWHLQQNAADTNSMLFLGRFVSQSSCQDLTTVFMMRLAPPRYLQRPMGCYPIPRAHFCNGYPYNKVKKIQDFF